jgi:threonine/homoserine/homoserine lactone efflux protein
MESSLTLRSIIALFIAMVTLAMIPSLSVLTVVARSAALGFGHGLATALGIVVGDFVFIILAIYSLSAVAENMNILFLLVKYGGGIYLIWSGIKLIRDRSTTIEVTQVETTSRLSSFFSGLSITLGDQKAIFFYLSFFSAFLDLKKCISTRRSYRNGDRCRSGGWS